MSFLTCLKWMQILELDKIPSINMKFNIWQIFTFFKCGMHMCPKDFERKRKYHSVIGDLFVFTLYLRKRIRLETDSRENSIGQNKKSIGWILHGKHRYHNKCQPFTEILWCFSQKWKNWRSFAKREFSVKHNFVISFKTKFEPHLFGRFMSLDVVSKRKWNELNEVW